MGIQWNKCVTKENPFAQEEHRARPSTPSNGLSDETKFKLIQPTFWTTTGSIGFFGVVTVIISGSVVSVPLGSRVSPIIAGKSSTDPFMTQARHPGPQ